MALATASLLRTKSMSAIAYLLELTSLSAMVFFLGKASLLGMANVLHKRKQLRINSFERSPYLTKGWAAYSSQVSVERMARRVFMRWWASFTLRLLVLLCAVIARSKTMTLALA